MAARRIAQNPGVSFDKSPPVSMIRGAEGTLGREARPPVPRRGGECGMFGQQIADGHRLVAGWAEAAHADAPAELPTVAAILITEVPALALWALIHRRLSRCVRWYGWKRSRMSTPPGSLTVSWRAKALTPNRLERGATQRAGHRLAIVRQRCFRRHGQPPWRVDRAAARPCQTWLGPIGRCPQT